MVARFCIRHAVYLVLFVVAAICGWPLNCAIADPPDILRNYRFITDKSTVEVTGGFAGVDWPLNILGSVRVGNRATTKRPVDQRLTCRRSFRYAAIHGRKCNLI